MNLVEFSKQAYTQGGGSFNLLSGEVNPTSGYMVSTPNNEVRMHFMPSLTEKEKIHKLTEQVFLYMAEKFDLWYYDSSMYLGLWYDAENKLWYIDLSQNIQDKDKAMEIARANKQLAIWDCENKETIHTYFKN